MATKKTTKRTKSTKKPAVKKPVAKKTVSKKPVAKTPAKRTIAKKSTKTTSSKKPTATSTKKTNLKPVSQNKGKKTIGKSSKKVEKRDEFRTHKQNGHPSYIYEKVGNRYKYIGITHSEITQGVKNIKLETNPNSKDKRIAYARPVSRQDKVKKFKNKTMSGWKMSESDKKKIKPLTKSKW